MVQYKYDAWGNHKVLDASGAEISDLAHIGHLNPFRYRSYYYDSELGLYFLQSRYYDPELGRFVTIDDLSYLDPDTVNGLNLYAYCLNNPVMYSDPTGHSPAWWEWVIGGVALVGGIALCFVPGAQAIGVSLIVSGASMTASNIMSAAGVDSKIASIILSGLNLVGGVGLCFTPFAGIGASMIGSGVGSLAGGYISEAFGGSFSLGSDIGNLFGGFASSKIYNGLQNAGKIGKWVKLSTLKANSYDDINIIGYSDEALSYWTKMLANNPGGYNTLPNREGLVEAITIIKNSNNVLQNGHHRVYVMKNIINNARKYIKVFFK